MFNLFINGDIEDDKKEERNETMDHQVEIDAVDLDINRIGSEISGDKVFIDRASTNTVGSDVLRAAIDHISNIIDHRANVCLKSLLDHFMLQKLRNVV